MADCLLGLGSNLGDRAAQLERACALLGSHAQIRRARCSSFHTTPPVGGPQGQTPYLNAALRITTSLTPPQLLAVTRSVEQQLGRVRRQRWGPRVIDIDVLLYNGCVEETDELVLPHPRMALRRFVLAPACEVAADMIHPPTGWTIARLLQRLDESPHYVAIAGVDRQQTAELAATAAQLSGAELLPDPRPVRGSAGEREGWSSAQELALIAARREQLTRLAQGTPGAAAGWHVCSYWLPQSLAVARAWLEEAARQQVEQACREAVQQSPLPHCVLLLDTLTPAQAAGVQAPADVPAGTAVPPLPPQRHAALMRALAHQTACPNQGPVLRVAAGDLQLAVTELTAAMDAMR